MITRIYIFVNDDNHRILYFDAGMFDYLKLNNIDLFMLGGPHTYICEIFSNYLESPGITRPKCYSNRCKEGYNLSNASVFLLDLT